MPAAPAAVLRSVLALAAMLSSGAAAGAAGEPPAAYAVCQNCHNPTAGTLAPEEEAAMPRLGGQQPDYLRAALQAYRTRQRNHFFMRGTALGLTRQQEESILVYLTAGRSLPNPQAEELPDAPLAALRCIGCHGDATRAPAAPDTPRLAGQNASYLSTAFRAYADGRRQHDIMGSQAASPSGPTLDDAALDAVTRWYARLPGLASR